MIDNFFNNNRKSNSELKLRNDFVFNRNNFDNDAIYICDIMLTITALSENSEKYMIKISEMEIDYQELWADAIGKFIEVESEEKEEQNNDSSYISNASKKISSSSLRTMIKEKSKEKLNTSYMKTIKEKDDLIEKMRKQSTIDKQKLEETLHKTDEFDMIVRTKEQEIRNMERRYEKEIEQYKNEIRQYKEKEKNNSCIREENEKLKKDIEILTKKIDELRENGKGENDTSEAKKKLKEEVDKLLKANSDNLTLIDKIKKEKDSYKEKIDTLQLSIIEQKEKYEREISSLKSDKEQANQSEEKIKSIIKQYMNEIDIEDTNISDYISLAEKIKAENINKQNELNEMEQRLNSKDKELIEKEKELLVNEKNQLEKEKSLINKEKELKAYNENKQKQNDANIQKTLSLLKTENIKLKLEIDQLTEEHSKLMLKLKEGNSSVKQSGDEITALIQKHFKISSVTEQEIINLSNKLSKYKLEIKESNDLIDHDKLVIDHLSEEISKLKKSKAKLEQDKQKIKQESLLLKKSMLEMKSKSDREYEMVTSSLMKLSNKFKALKAEMYNSKIN